MTCIVAVRQGGRIVIGGDSAGVGGLALRVRADPKVFRLGPALVGFTTSFRMGQILRFGLTWPDHDPRIDADKFMCTVFVDAVRGALKTGGFASKSNETEQGGTFLVAYQGRIFRVDSDYQIAESSHAFDACGCGEDLALGSLWSTESSGLNTLKRAELALSAAETFSAGVRRPFLYEHIDFDEATGAPL